MTGLVNEAIKGNEKKITKKEDIISKFERKGKDFIKFERIWNEKQRPRKERGYFEMFSERPEEIKLC